MLYVKARIEEQVRSPPPRSLRKQWIACCSAQQDKRFISRVRLHSAGFVAHVNCSQFTWNYVSLPTKLYSNSSIIYATTFSSHISRRVVAGFSPLRRRFSSSVVHMGLVVDKLALRQLQFSPTNCYSKEDPYYLSSGDGAIDQFATVVARDTVSPHTY